MKGLLPIGFLLATTTTVIVLAPAAHAQKCMSAGGYGTGMLEGFAAFMAKTAMKNAAKARLGKPVRFGAVSNKCNQNGFLFECHARARACHAARDTPMAVTSSKSAPS